jgi:hypothetical protein
MSVDPADTPATTPALLTVATPVFEETQGFTAAGLAEPLNAVVDPTHTIGVPVMVGKAFTVKTTVT